MTVLALTNITSGSQSVKVIVVIINISNKKSNNNKLDMTWITLFSNSVTVLTPSLLG